MSTKSAHQLWKAALGQLEVEIPRPNFETFLRDTVADRLENGVLTINTSSSFAAVMLEQRLSTTIERAVERVANSPLEVRFAVRGDSSSTFVPDESSPGSTIAVFDPGDGEEALAPARSASRNRLKPEFTFDMFVSGSSNELAHAAALQVADSPGAAFNPLYIYSAVGLGKTHLMQAIGHRLQEKASSVLYVSAEQFTNEFILAVRNGATEDFRARYRGVDTLLIDDIQFIMNKPQTQEGFFHTFNELHMSGRQIVVSGDRPAEQIKLEDRIQSRLAGGLVVDIQPPDYELRYAILERKASARGITVPGNVLDMLAGPETDSVRDLEGSLNRVLAFAQFTDGRVDIGLAERALLSVGSRKPQAPPSPEAVVAAVAAHTGVPESSLTGPRRDRRTSSARRMAAYLLREESKLSTTQVGNALGGKDHSTVLYAQNKFEEEMSADKELRHLVAEARRALHSSVG